MAGVYEWARDVEDYPGLDDLINTLAAELAPDMHYIDTLRAVRDVFIGLHKATIRGLVVDSTEQYWATAAVRANERGLEAS